MLFQEEPHSHDHDDRQPQDDPGEGALFRFPGDGRDVVVVIVLAGGGFLLLGRFFLLFQVLDQAQLGVQRPAAGAAKDTGIVVHLAAAGTAF